MNMVKCMVCYRSFRRITKSHLETHGIENTAEYLKIFPGVEYIASDILASESARMKATNPMHNSENRQKLSKSLIGKQFSPEHREKISNSRKGKPTRFGPHSEETKDKIRDKLKGRFVGELNPMFGVSLTVSQETIEKRKQTVKDRKESGIVYNTNKGKTLNLSDEQRENRSEKRCLYLKNNDTNKRDTDIELKFKCFLEENRVKYEQQFLLTDRGSWLFDFYLPDTNQLIEIDGEYWHRKKHQINRDRIKENIALRMNYNFVRISSENLYFDIIFSDNDTINSHNKQIIEERELLWK